MKTLNVGLIGFGLSGRIFHAPIITSTGGFSLYKIMVRNPEKLENTRKLYPDAEVVHTFEDVIEDPEVDLVVIALPNVLHYDMASQALKAGKHVIVEKPFTLTHAEADNLIRLSEETGKLLTVYHNRRFDGDFMTLQKIIASGKLGQIKVLESHFDRFRNKVTRDKWNELPQPGSGLLYDIGSHLIDQALVLFGMPMEIYADVYTQRTDSPVDDAFDITLYYDDLRVILKSSMLVKEPIPRFIVQGDCGTFVKYGLDTQEHDLKSGLRPDEQPDWGEDIPDKYGIINYEKNDLQIRGSIETLRGDYRLFYQKLYTAILNGGPLPVTAYEARNVIYLIQCALQSSDVNQRIVV